MSPRENAIDRKRSVLSIPKALLNFCSPGKPVSWIVLIVFLVFGCSSSENDENAFVMNKQIDFSRLNVVVILIDTLRADHLGIYGYDRNTSPNIDNLAAKGVVFERAYAPSSFTRESVASLFTGYYPWHGGHSDWDAHPLPELETMAEMFSTAGYQTGFFSNSIMIQHQDFLRGFNEVAFPDKSWSPSRKGYELSTAALEYAKTLKDDRPFFMYVHYMDPHGSYDPPLSLLKKFERVQVEDRLHLYKQLRSDLRRLKLKGFGPDDPRFINLVDRYDAEIAHTDAAIQALMDGLEELDKVENTLFIITSDHGEEFMEHKSVEHGWTLYNEVIHVPLIFYAPRFIRP